MRLSPILSHSPIAVGAVALVVGALGVWRCPDSLGIRFSEAFFIAGFLSLTVDLYLKAKLQRDTAADIFHHLLGINLPLEIRNSIRDDVLQNKRFIRNMQMEVRAQRVDGDRVRLSIMTNSNVVATSAHEYQPSLQFEEAEHPTVEEVSLNSATNSRLNFQQTNIQLKPKKDEPEVVEWKGKKTNLNIDDTVAVHAKFAVERGLHDFWVSNFGTPAIHLTLRLYCDDSLKITASTPDDLNGSEYLYKRVFTIGDHIQIRWKPKEKES